MDENLLKMKPSELREFATVLAQEIVKEMRRKSTVASPWISKHAATKLSKSLGRKKLDAYIRMGLVTMKPIPDETKHNPHATIYVLLKDVEKLIANPII